MREERFVFTEVISSFTLGSRSGLSALPRTLLRCWSSCWSIRLTHPQMARTHTAVRNPQQYTGPNLIFKAGVLGV